MTSALSELEAAAIRAARFYPRVKGLRTVYVNGAAAALAGRSLDTCPYGNLSRNTWRTSWRRAWMLGYWSVAPEGV